MANQAEKLKIKFGSALADEVYENRIITIPGLRGRDPREILERNLAMIIQARVEEILDYVLAEVKRSGFERKLIAGIVFTGGGALLNHIDKLAEYHTGMSARIGVPVEHLAHGYLEQLGSPIYATAIGLLIRAFEHPVKVTPKATPAAPTVEEEGTDEAAQGGKWYEQLFKKTKEWFEAEPDSEF
jgi:cell division protein FtsA